MAAAAPAWAASWCLLLASADVYETGLVFTTRRGTPIEPRNFDRSFDRRIVKADVPRMRSSLMEVGEGRSGKSEP
jgi:hypothetical protein